VPPRHPRNVRTRTAGIPNRIGANVDEPRGATPVLAAGREQTHAVRARLPFLIMEECGMANDQQCIVCDGFVDDGRGPGGDRSGGVHVDSGYVGSKTIKDYWIHYACVGTPATNT
jgi:hypothetical protein